MEPGFTGTTSSGMGTGQQPHGPQVLPRLLVSLLSHPPHASHFFLVQCHRVWCLTDVLLDLGFTRGGAGLCLSRAEVEVGGPRPKEQNVYFVMVISEIVLKYRKV